jgi:hypothetical protein
MDTGAGDDRHRYGQGHVRLDQVSAEYRRGHARWRVQAGRLQRQGHVYLPVSERLLTDLTVPKLDGSSKDVGAFDVRFEAETVRWSKGASEELPGKPGSKTKAWLCSNFRVTIGTLPCTRVATIDSFTWHCPAPIAQHKPVVLVPDLRLTISIADYDAWTVAAKKWFIDGELAEANEMTGKITFLAPNLADELGSIDLLNIGFKKFERPVALANSESIERFAVELYVEKMMLNIKEYDV